MSAVFSPSRKAWKKTAKAAAEVNADQEKGNLKSVWIQCSHEIIKIVVNLRLCQHIRKCGIKCASFILSINRIR